MNTDFEKWWLETGQNLEPVARIHDNAIKESFKKFALNVVTNSPIICAHNLDDTIASLRSVADALEKFQEQ